jgi:sulfur carrier protein
MKINGEEIKLNKPVKLEDFLNEQGFDENRIVVERNGEIIPKNSYNAIKLSDEDVYEIVSFVGGG